jgi:hypothetical protein
MMPVETDELTYHLAAAPIQENAILPTPELAAVQESLELPVQEAFTPTDEPWLNATRLAIIRAVRASWSIGTDYSQKEARGAWLLSILPDPLAWCLAPQNEMVWTAVRQQAATQVGYLMFFVEGKLEVRRRFYEWLDKALPLKKSHRGVWEEAVNFLKATMMRILEMGDEA